MIERLQDIAAEQVRVLAESNLSLLKSGHVRGVRFETLSKICEFLECQPGDRLAYVPDEEEQGS